MMTLPNSSLRPILADPQLRVRFLEICRSGRVRADGRKIRYCGIQTEGRISVTRVIETTFQIIPAEDWAALELYDSSDGLRLEGSREFFDPDLLFELRGWAFVRFSGDDLRALTRSLIEDALGKVVSTATVVRRTPPAEKPFWDKARVEARKWLDEQGYPEHGDGGKAKMERHIMNWLEPRGYKAARSTIRSHVGRWIQEYRDNPEAE
jgi:hypothetical protein